MKKFLVAIIVLLALPLTVKGQINEKIKVACIGNSVTYGYGHSNPGETSYPSQLQQMLGHDQYEVRNFGHSGATLLNKGHRPYINQAVYEQAMQYGPDLAVIHLGLNDTDPRNWPNFRDEFIPDYLSLIDDLRESNPNVKIWICRMTPIFNWHGRFKSGTRDWFWQIQDAIENVAQIANVELIDLHSPLYARPDLFADALHPNEEGAQILANTVYGALTGMYGGLQLPAVYGSGMVIQRGEPFVLQGKANAGAKVEAKLGKQRRSAVAGADGCWTITFDAMNVGKPMTLTVKSETVKLKYDDVVVGEVWICSGQSNMAWCLKNSNDAQHHMAQAKNKNVRLYNMQPRVITDPVKWDSTELVNINRLNYFKPTRWEKADEENAGDFSAIAYHFGAMLADSLGVPVGLICNAVGGATIESYIDRKTMEHHPVLVDILSNWKHNDFVQGWVRSRASENIEKSTNKLQRHPYQPCYLYETGVAPIASYNVKGVIWYQGESNAHNVELYEHQLPALIGSWRMAWGNDEMPFHIIQLSSINRDTWPHFRDTQRRLALAIENCEMAVSSDKGHPTDVHPRDKEPIGQRLARLALHYDYGFSHVVPSGPVVKSVKCDGNEVIVEFDNAHGLATSDDAALRTFELADKWGVFHAADVAVIDGEKVRLSSSKVAVPKFVRYGWQPFTTANLVNGEGLPASTFKAVVE